MEQLSPIRGTRNLAATGLAAELAPRGAVALVLRFLLRHVLTVLGLAVVAIARAVVGL